jgi:acylphosphatase
VGAYLLILTEQAKELGLKGWVQNTSGGTVIGIIQGPNEEIESVDG